MGQHAKGGAPRRRHLLVIAGVVLALVGALLTTYALISRDSEVVADVAAAPSATPVVRVSPAATPAAPSGGPVSRGAVRKAKKAPPRKIVRAGTPLRRLTPAELRAIAEREAAARAAAEKAEHEAATAAAAEAEEEAARAAAGAPFSFRVATLNVLGSNHTEGKGGLGPGTERAHREAQLIKSRGIDLIGMQEVQPDQRAVFSNQLGGYTIWPKDALGNQGYRLQIAWRNDLFEFVSGGGRTHTFNSIPNVPIPYALLRSRVTGGEFYVVNAHNSPQGLQREREASTAIEADLVNDLQSTGRPVIMVGDMNEQAGFFCRISGRTGLVSANGGYFSGGCHPPAPPLKIDWVLGSGNGVDFSGYRQDPTPRETGMSDHYLIYADATVTGP